MTTAKLNILILAILIATAYSQCPTGCSTCANPTSCTACSARYFLVNGTFCAPCPNGCSACTQGADGRPACTACVAPAQLDSNGQCFLCDPNCLTCAITARNCTTCRDGKELTANNTCGAPAGCNISNCGACANDAEGNLICSRCLQGYFPYRQGCLPCKFSCESCTFDRALIWPGVSGFWDAAIRAAFNISGAPTPGVLPPFVNNLDWTGMNETLKRGWTEAFLIASMASTTFVNVSDFAAIIPPTVRLFAESQNRTWDQIQRLIVQKFNNITAKNWTLMDFNTKLSQAAAELTTCDNCGAGFTLRNNTCTRCPAGCTQCASGTCTACRDGTFLGPGAVCTPCTAPCATCSTSATTCTACVSPTSLVGSTCVLCEEPCATCQSASRSTCVTCKKPFSTLASAAGTCFRCDQDLCDKCQQTNTTICLLCRPGATLIDGRCQLCPANCSNCFVGTNTSTCFQCNQGYELNITATNETRCLPCGPGCRMCSQRICLECQPGTYLERSNGTCLRCKKGCTACTSLQVCTAYESGVLIINDKVVTCRPGCKTCTTPQVCTQCESRFFLNTDVCRPCEPGCVTCSSATVCTKCADNLILATGDCTACVGNCRTCNPANVSSCLTCKRGFTLVGTDCIHQCERGCMECDATNSSICITCLQGNALKQDGKCVKCLGSCSGSCDPRNISICLTCVDGFELKDNQCVRCPMGCATCLVGECSTCVPGYTLSQSASGSFICAQKCKAPCSSCSSGACLGCQTGFTFNNGRCDPDLSCNPNCDFCPAGTEKLVNGSCAPCPTSCATCSSGTCSACLPGFFLNSTVCSACAPRCKTCLSSAQKCDECSPGFVKQIVSMTSSIADAVFSDNCTACSPNCRTCIVEPDRCTSCPEGSRLKGSRCAGMFTVEYQYEINIAYSTFLQNSQSESFIQTLSNMAGVDSADNFINFVKEGSTIVGGTVSTGSSTQATAVQGSLGSSVGSYPILASSASVYYGDSAYTEEKKQETKTSVNIGLIVGVVVGGVVAIALISFIIYKVKAKKQHTQIKQDTSVIELNQKY